MAVIRPRQIFSRVNFKHMCVGVSLTDLFRARDDGEGGSKTESIMMVIYLKREGEEEHKGSWLVSSFVS